MNFQIKNRFTDAVMFSCELPPDVAAQSGAQQLGWAIKAALKARADLAAPTSRTPTSRTPTSRAPTSRAPTSRAPTSRAPTSRVPTSRAPTSPAPTSRLPRGRLPNKCQKCSGH